MQGPTLSKTPWFSHLCHECGNDCSGRPTWSAHERRKPSEKEVTRYMGSLSFYDRLHEEISAFATWLEPTPNEVLKKLEVIARVMFVSQALWPQSRVVPFGSFTTGLSLPDGDVDLCIENAPDLHPVDLVSDLARVLKRCPFAREVIAIKKARIPIVKYQDWETKCQVDISINQDSASDTSHYTRRMVIHLRVYCVCANCVHVCVYCLHAYAYCVNAHTYIQTRTF